MRLLPTSLQILVQELSKLPGVGEKTALRYAVALLKEDSRKALGLERALKQASQDIATCPRCFFWRQGSQCPLCEDTQRTVQQLCIVRDCPDVLALEKFRSHAWKYHVLQGLLAPLSGVGPSQLRLEALFNRLETESVEEFILALDSTVEGDATSLYIRDVMKNSFPHIRVTRLASGLPAGAAVEYLDAPTLERALHHRIPFEMSES